MSTCQACMRRYLRTFVGDLHQVSISSRSKPTNGVSRRSARNYTSFAAKEKLKPDSSGHRNKVGDGLTSNTNARQEWIESRGVRPAWKEKAGVASSIDRETAQELKHLQDPLKLADFIRRKLQKGNFEDAQKFVRAASKHSQCVVSWNHLISWQLSKGSLNAALKTYNEMKKRAQFPDGHTYSIIFNGCSMHPSPDHALGKALPIYHSMSSEKSPIKPTVVHVNALLKLCARALNTEALLAIVAEMPSKGVGSPNNLTYTTVFNALRFFATGGMRDTHTPMLKRQNSEKAMLEARHIWVEITKRWAQGDIFLDEELVSAFGRLLLLGGRRDRDDILSLIEQTMNIPRQVPRLGTVAREAVDPLASTPKLPPHTERETTSDSPALEQPNGNPQPEIAVADLFQPVKAPTSPGQRRGVFAKPGQNSLSLVLEALLKLKLKEAAQKYWRVFTTQHNVQPDLENFHAYLRILRVARASNEATNVLQRIPMQDLKYSTFRIAMAACRRDKLNRNAFANGGRLLDLMQTALREPDVPFLEDYLELAITAPAYSKKVSSSGKSDWSKLEQGKQIQRALERLNPSLLNLKAMLHFEDPLLAEKTPHERSKLVDSILSLTRRMISSYDLLVHKAFVPRDFHGTLKQQRGKLSAFVARHKILKNAEQDRSKWKRDNAFNWSADALAVIASPEAIPSFEVSEKDTPPTSLLKKRGFATKAPSRTQTPTMQPGIAEGRSSKKRGAISEIRTETAAFDEKVKNQLFNEDTRDLNFKEQKAAA